MANISAIQLPSGDSFDLKDKNAMPIVTYGTKSTLVNTTTVSFSKDGDNDWYCTIENPISGFTKNSFMEGYLYIVTWDGTEYQTLVRTAEVATDDGYYEWTYFGNAYIMGWRNAVLSDNQLPFCVEYDFYRNSGEVQIFTSSTTSAHTIKIEVIPFTIIKVDPAFYTDTHHQVPLIRTGTGQGSIIIGMGPKDATGEESVAMGAGVIASGVNAVAEGEITISSGRASHAEGYGTVASGVNSHAEGQRTVASGNKSHAEGQRTTASGPLSHTEGDRSIASGSRSHCEGSYTVANHFAQHVFGKYNVADPSTEAATVIGNYVEIVGNGTADNARSNARTLDWNGNEVLAGTITATNIPAPPNSNGTYYLTVTINNGSAAYSWSSLPIYDGTVTTP